jgi:integrase
MGFARKRIDQDGRERYAAIYRDLRGRIRSAGTFTTDKQADKAWQRAEARLADGRVADPRRGRQSFRRYVEEEWLPNHVIEATTREGYTYSINKHILPWFGKMRMADITPAQVREWITEMAGSGIAPGTVKNLRAILSAIFTTALNDQIMYFHPCKGVKTAPVPEMPLQVITPEQFDRVYAALPTADARLLVEADIECGARWGELTELRVFDLDRSSRILTISRTVVEIDPKFHPDGGRFLVKKYTKGRKPRRVKLSEQITTKLGQHIDELGLRKNDLIFAVRETTQPAETAVVPVDPEALGFTEPNPAGRVYRHATLSAYSAGGCRCQHCRRTYSAYRAARRNAGKDSPRRSRRVRDTDGHISRDWFRTAVWSKALKAAEIEFHVRMHDLRHAHASWLLAGGADLQVVKERLGHASISTTEKYLHTLPKADETALSAFDSIRNRSRAA